MKKIGEIYTSLYNIDINGCQFSISEKYVEYMNNISQLKNKQEKQKSVVKDLQINLKNLNKLKN